MPEINPIKLANSVTKSRVYFRHERWQGKRTCPRCQCRNINHLTNRYACKKCRYKFDDFTGTYIAKIRIPPNTIVHLLYLFSLGVPAYRIRFYVEVSLKTIEHTFRIFREAIYDSSLINLRLSGKLELDEAMFGGHRKGKRGWGAEGKTLVFGIYKRNGQVMTFPVPNRKYDTLIEIIKNTEGFTVFAQDESIFIVDAIFRKKMWVKKETLPIILVNGSRQKTIIFGALGHDGKQFFRQYDKFDQYCFW